MLEECVDVIYHMGLAETYCQRVVEAGDLGCVDKAFRELRRAYELAPDDKRVCFLVIHYARLLSFACDYSNRIFKFFLAQLAPRSETLQEMVDDYGLEEEIEETSTRLDITRWEALKLILERPDDWDA